jgi:hypothetical protein
MPKNVSPKKYASFLLSFAINSIHKFKRGDIIMRHVHDLTIGLVLLFLLTACSLPVTKVAIQSMGLEKPGYTKEQAMTSLTTILVNRGFDIKLANKEAGLITTEYKQFAATGETPPFDYSMQIKGRILETGGKIKITLSPIVKEQNRMNAAAYSEHELSYFVGDPHNVQFIKSMRTEVGWRVLGQILFMNVAQDTAEAFGLKVEDLTQNVTKTPADAFEERNY